MTTIGMQTIMNQPLVSLLIGILAFLLPSTTDAQSVALVRPPQVPQYVHPPGQPVAVQYVSRNWTFNGIIMFLAVVALLFLIFGCGWGSIQACKACSDKGIKAQRKHKKRKDKEKKKKHHRRPHHSDSSSDSDSHHRSGRSDNDMERLHNLVYGEPSSSV